MNDLNEDFKKARLAKIERLEAKLAELTRVWEDKANQITMKEYIVEFDKTQQQLNRLLNAKN